MKRYLSFSVLLLFVLSGTVLPNSWLELDVTERNDGGYFTLQTDVDDIVTKTARILDVGDSYIDRNNHRYEVIGFDEDTIKVELKEVVTLPNVADILPTTAQPTFLQRVFGLTATTGTQDNNWNTIGIYFTHNAESYVPTSGVESKDEGDIQEVGKTLAEALRADGFEVVVSENSHLPHDGEAYSRSRRTVMEMIQQQQPATLIDIHRDATPPEVYATQIEGQDATRIRIVVGRQNQNREATLEYAKRIKALADEQFPDMIEGIFDAKGNYNQDLGPRMILLEFGAHTNPLKHAQTAAEFFAKVIPAAAGLSSPAAARSEDGSVGAAARRSILWVLGIAAALTVGFVVLNKQGVGSLRIFLQRELAGKRSDNDGEENQE